MLSFGGALEMWVCNNKLMPTKLLRSSRLFEVDLLVSGSWNRDMRIENLYRMPSVCTL